MNWWPFARRQNEREAHLDRELRFHIEERVADLVRTGLSEAEARRLVRHEFGGIEQVKDECRDAHPARKFADLQQDLGYATRMMLWNPALAVVVVSLLALGIGASTSVFSIVDAVLLKTMPYPSAQTLVRVEETSTSRKLSGIPVRHFQRWADRSDVFEAIAPYLRDTVTLTGDGEPEHVVALRSIGLFPVLGINASLGRTLGSADDQESATRVTVLSDRLWRRRYHADPNVVGRTVIISDEPYVVAGIMPPEFEFHYPETELWTPLRLTATSPWIQVAARLRKGVSIPQAQSALEVVAHQIRMEQSKDYPGLRIEVKPWRELLDEKFKSTLIFVMASVSLMMLIVCVNVGSLLLSRAITRQKEICIRASLGAGRWRILRQLLCESLALAIGGSLLGVLLAKAVLAVVTKHLAALPIAIPHLQRVSLDERALGFSILLCLVATVLCSLAPMLVAARTDLQAPLRGGPAAASPRGSTRLFSTLIALEAGFAFLLLVGSGLLVRSLFQLQQEDRGFRPDHVLTLRVPLGSSTQPRPKGKYDSRARQMAYYREILERVRTVPGIKSAAIVNNLPLSGINSSLNFSIPGPDGKSGPTSARTISPQYFAAMGIPLIEGRDFNDRDQAGAPDVAIINQHLARLLFPDRSPLGQKLSTESGEPGATIVGVVKDSAQTSYEAPFAPEVYIPYQQFVFATFMSTIVVRTEGEPTGLSPMLREKVWEVDPNQPVVHIQTMEDVVAKSIWRPRFSAWIVSVLSALSLVLIAAGVYAVVATTSSLREHELGIRVAVGATASDVSFEILRGALIPLACGLGIGAAAALALSRLLTNLLHGVSSYDPLTYFSAGALLIGIGAAASLRPAWRASTRDPLRTLRAD